MNKWKTNINIPCKVCREETASISGYCSIHIKEGVHKAIFNDR